jgi:uncharacterized repeat protein (TIGR01451 family)
MRKKRSILLTIFLIAIIGFVNFSPNISVNAASLGNIHGTIIGEEGEPIENVKVYAISTTGSIEETKYTDDKGYFRMNLGGSYTLVFEKEGYVIEERSVKVTIAPTTNPDNDAVKLGEITLEKTLKISVSVLNRLTSPGNTLLVDFNIENLGEETENIEFFVSAPENWDTRILDSIGEINSILLSPGTETYFLEIVIPQTAIEAEIITITASGSTTSNLELSIIPKISIQEIEIKSTYLSISEELGQKIILPFTLSNIGEVEKIIILESYAPENWVLDFKTTTDMVVKRLLLTPEQSETLNLEVDPYESALVGEYSIIINAVDNNGNICDSLEFDVNLRAASSELEVVSSFSKVTVEAGETMNFPLAIWNQGEKDALVLLNIPVVPVNWNTAFIADDIEVSSLILLAGESESIELEVTPPNAVESGEYTLEVLIESDDGTKHKIKLAITVEGSYELELELSTLYTTVTIGNSVSYTAKVTNRGQTAVTTLYLEAIIPDEWDATITPVQVQSLNPRDSVTFTIISETPSDTVTGDYLLTMQAISDQLESDQTDVRITAQASTSWGFIGVGLAAIAVVGAVFIFKKFKRR